MKKILAMAAVAALAAGASAYAANPFSDVSTSDWAYQAVADLSAQGIVEGYPDGTFGGQKNITRYEMAQIIARMMAKEDQYNAEQRATIDKLAAEYADELDSLGVRVSNLEKKVGNISWSGDARMRYQSKDNSAEDAWTGRVRINMKGQVNENTTVNARLSTGNVNLKDDGDADVTAELLNVKHDFGAWDVTLGRYAVTLGNQGGWLYGDSNGFDGVQVGTSVGKVNLKVGYGQFNAGSTDWTDTTGYVTWNGEDHTATAAMTENTLKDQDVFYAQADADLGAFDLYANYYTNLESNPNEDFNIWGVGLKVPVGDFRVFGEYWNNTADTGSVTEDDAWNAGIGYGKMDLQKPGTWSLDVAYNEVGAGVYLGGTGLSTDILDPLWKINDAAPVLNGNYGTNNYSQGEWDYAGAQKVTFWNAIADVALMQNTYLHAEYAFAADADNGEDPEDTWTVSLNYVF